MKKKEEVTATDFQDVLRSAVKQQTKAKKIAKQVEKQLKEDEKAAKQAEKKALAEKRMLEFEGYDLSFDEDGKMLKIASNYINLLTRHDAFKDIRLNDFSQLVWYGDEQMSDFHLSMIRNSLTDLSEGRLGTKDMTIDAINEIAFNNRFNEVKEYLEDALKKWDGRPRIEKMFCTFLGAADCELYSAMAKRWMVAAVKRVYEPGCKFDNVIILTGAQGIGKSNFCEKLAVKPEWFCSDIQIKDKDGYLQIADAWIGNFDELGGLTRRESSDTKSFISARFDKFRSPYGHFTQTAKRHCVFIGSTNDERFLKDDGSVTERRFWVIKCTGDVNDSVKRFKMLTDDEIAQLWGEAMHYYQEGQTPLYIDGNLFDKFAADQRQYKTATDTPLFYFLDEALDKYYYDFDDAKSLRDQYRAPINDPTKTAKRQNFFSITALDMLCSDNHIEVRKGCGYAAYAMYSDGRWKYTTKRVDGHMTRGLERVVEEPQAPQALIKTDVFGNPTI